jgi:hypothetical protein
MKTHYSILLFCTTLFFNKCFSQNKISGNEIYSDSSGGYIELFGMGASADRTPFWMHANQFGIVPKTGSTGSARLGLEKFWNLQPEGKGHFRAGIGVEVVGNLGETQQFILPQAYGSLRFKNWELYVGRKKQCVGLADSTLGTGSYVWSGNALPIPKIQIGTTRFVPIPFTNGWLSFNAFYSDGVFEKGRQFTSGLKLHQKALYLKIGNRNSRLKLLGGLNHQVQWGGNSPFETKNGKMPDGFKNYINVVTGKEYPVGEDLKDFDYNNRIGNHLGTVDMSLEYDGYEYRWLFYRQNIYEDGSLFSFDNFKDGLNGISIKKQNSYGANFEISNIVFEFLYTKKQGGDIWDLQKLLGRDNYFNHGQVRDGWSYYDRTIGTPFIPPTTDTYWKWPAYFFTSNNRVMVLHLGLGGSLFQRIRWQSKLSYSSNSGTYDLPFNSSPTQFSGILSFQTNVKLFGGSTISGSFAGDSGQLYQNTFGFSLALRKNFSF